MTVMAGNSGAARGAFVGALMAALSRAGQSLARSLAPLVLLLMAASMVALPARAHEIQASVADIDLTGGRVVIDMRTNLEAMIAGVGTSHEDTDESPVAGEYDALRALAPEALRARLDVFAPELLNAVEVTADGARVPLALGEVEIAPVGDLELARDTRLTLTGDLPAGTGAATIRMDEALGDLIVRGTGGNAEYGEFLQNGSVSQPIAVAGATERGAGQVFVQYLGVGYEHILPLGLDHILFVVGLFLLSPRARPLLWQVTAFTLAHTVTLALGTLEIVNVPGSIVEPLIALSIVYVCVENLMTTTLTPWRPAIVFAFGLLHGLGFASVFEEYGIPDGQLVPALLAFNIGVEAGQLTVLAACFVVVGIWFSDQRRFHRLVTVPGSLVIGAIGLYWAVTRVGLVPEFLPYV